MTAIRGGTVVITGGASGLGRRLAGVVARRGGRPVLWDLHSDRLDEAVAELDGAGAAGYVCDVSDPAEVTDTARRVLSEVGDVDVLVNNAGIVSGRPFLDIDPQDVERTFRVNTLSLYWTTRAFLPRMLARGRGHVVTIASAAGLVGVARQTDYAASKWAAVGFDESLRAELRRSAPGVRTTVVCPFYIDTGMFEGAESRFPWLLPILHEPDVAAAIADAVEGDRRRLIMPPAVRLLPVLRALPAPVFDWFMDQLGVNRSMDHFVGRPDGDRSDRGG